MKFMGALQQSHTGGASPPKIVCYPSRFALITPSRLTYHLRATRKAPASTQ